MEDNPPINPEQDLMDPELYTILADLEKSDRCLSPPDTEKTIDYAVIRLTTGIALESHKEIGLTSKLTVDEYQIIKKAFEKEYGDECLALMLFYKQLHETIVEHIVNGRHKLTKHEEDLSQLKRNQIDQIIAQEGTLFAEKKENGTLRERDKEDISQYVIDMLRVKQVIDDKELSFPAKYSKDYMDLILEKIITENKILALDCKKKADQATDLEAKEGFRNAAEYHARIHSSLLKWKGQFSISPLWGRALEFLESINFREEFKNYDRKKEIAVKAALELYDITGVSLKTIADHFDELREFHGSITDMFGAEEGRLKKLSKNSKKGQTYLTFLYQADPRTGVYIAEEIFGYDSDEIEKNLTIVMKDINGEHSGFEFETEKLWFSQAAADAYIKQKKLGRRKSREEERARIKLKRLKSESDRVRMNIVDAMDDLQSLVGFAYSDKIYTSEEIEVLKVLAGLKYGTRDESVFDAILTDSKNMRIVVLDNDKRRYNSLRLQLINTSCEMLYTDNFGNLYDQYINTDEAPQVVLIGKGYQNEGVRYGEAIEFLVGDTQSTPHMRNKDIKILVLGNARKGGGMHKRELEEAHSLGAGYVSVLDLEGMLNVISAYGIEKSNAQ